MPMPKPMRSMSLYVVVLAAVAVLATVFSAQSASAHAEVREIYPANGSVLSTAPTEVRVTFGEDLMVGTGFLKVTGPGGEVTTTAEVTGPALRSALPSGLQQGGYRVTWRVTSADGHPVSGTWTFSVLPGGVPRTGIGMRPSSNASSVPFSPDSSSSPSASTTIPSTTTPTTAPSASTPASGDGQDSGGVGTTELLLGIGALVAAGAGVGTVLLKSRRRPPA